MYKIILWMLPYVSYPHSPGACLWVLQDVYEKSISQVSENIKKTKNQAVAWKMVFSTFVSMNMV